MSVERRFAPANASIEHRDGAPKIVGYAVVFNSPSDPMPMPNRDTTFIEIVRPGAFSQSLASGRAVFALFQHDQSLVLGSTQNGTLRLSQNSRGLRYEIDPPDTQAGRDTVELIRRGDVRASSFGFLVRDGGQSWRREGKQMIRELRSLELLDVAPVTIGAYPMADVALRSFEEWERTKSRRHMRLELAERSGR